MSETNMSSFVLLPTTSLEDRIIMRKAAEKFNISIKEGIQHLVSNKIIPDDSPKEIARVFHSIEVPLLLHFTKKREYYIVQKITDFFWKF